MNEFSLHPLVYATGSAKGLVNMLERVWLREHRIGDGTLYIVSGFGNYNGGVRFYNTFREHIRKGGQIKAFFAGSAAQRLTSRQLVEELVDCGAEVRIINRKRLMHAKIYGSDCKAGQFLVVTSGNFTGPGMSQNVEASLILDRPSTKSLGFSWPDVAAALGRQGWEIYPTTPSGPVWQLLYDEVAESRKAEIEEGHNITLVLTLSHSDTARINALPGTPASRGTQYFWLSKDCFDFFPPLTSKNRRGYKDTYSCLVTMNYIDIGVQDAGVRVTFEEQNNLDFRLGTGKLRGTRVAAEGDVAAISRVAEAEYELRIFRKKTPIFKALSPFAVNFIGNRGKRYGFIGNLEFGRIAGVKLSQQQIRPAS